MKVFSYIIGYDKVKNNKMSYFHYDYHMCKFTNATGLI